MVIITLYVGPKHEFQELVLRSRAAMPDGYARCRCGWAGPAREVSKRVDETETIMGDFEQHVRLEEKKLRSPMELAKDHPLHGIDVGFRRDEMRWILTRKIRSDGGALDLVNVDPWEQWAQWAPQPVWLSHEQLVASMQAVA